jgi:NADPH2:quinone reductase
LIYNGCSEEKAMTRANVVQFHRYGGPEVLCHEEVDIPDPGPAQVLIRQTAVGLNFIDIQHRKGRYLAKRFPVVPGIEGAGVIEAVGRDVTEFRKGDRVAYLDHFPAAYIELRVIEAERVVKLPDFISDEIAAAIMLKGLTANYLLRGSYHVRAGDTILVHAAAGGVGLIMCQWARRFGARVIGIVGTAEKAQLASDHGCDHVIVRSTEDIISRVRSLTGGLGVPVVYDSVGANTFDISLACLRQRGLLVSFGTASGPIPPFDIFRLNNNHHMGQGGSLYVTSASVFDFTRERGEYLARVSDLFEVVRSGIVKVRLNRRYALADAAQAHRDLESGKTTGCSVLLP